MGAPCALRQGLSCSSFPHSWTVVSFLAVLTHTYWAFSLREGACLWVSSPHLASSHPPLANSRTWSHLWSCAAGTHLTLISLRAAWFLSHGHHADRTSFVLVCVSGAVCPCGACEISGTVPSMQLHRERCFELLPFAVVCGCLSQRQVTVRFSLLHSTKEGLSCRGDRSVRAGLPRG